MKEDCKFNVYSANIDVVGILEDIAHVIEVVDDVAGSKRFLDIRNYLVNNLVKGGCTFICLQSQNGKSTADGIAVGSAPFCHNICDDQIAQFTVSNEATLKFVNAGDHTLFANNCWFNW